MTCKTCKWFDVPLDKRGRRIIRKANAYRCTVPTPPRPPLPTSILENFGFNWPPRRTMMHESIWDQVCLMWEKWEKPS